VTIVVFGSINIDLTTYGERLPKPGETLFADRYVMGLGGKGCNQAVAAAQLGAETLLVGRVGNDSFGQRALAAVTDFGLTIKQVVVDPDSATGLAVISVNAAAENCITVISGANKQINPDDVRQASTVVDRAAVLLLQMEIPLEAGLVAADRVRQHGGKVILDPAPAPEQGLAEHVLSRIDVITPNEMETAFLTGILPETPQQAAEAAANLRSRGVALAVIKMGAKGVYFQQAENEEFIPPFKVHSVDSVAAGDCFNGGLACALAEGKSAAQAVRFAAACGALATTKAGAATSAPALTDVVALLSR